MGLSGSARWSWLRAASIHQQVVRAGAVLAWAGAAVIVIVGLVADDAELARSAIGPGTAAVLMTAQTLAGRERAGVAMFGSAAILALTHTLLGGSGSVALSVAMVVVSAVAAMFVEHRTAVALVLPAAALFLMPMAWDIPRVQALTSGLVNASAFALAAVVFIGIRREVTRYSDRNRALFDESPAAVLEEDWSESVEYLKSEYDGKPERIEKFLLAYPNVLREAVSKAKVLRANPAAVELLEAPSEESLLGNRDGTRVTDVNLESWASILGAFYRKEPTYGIDLATVTRKGRPIWVQVRGADTDPDRPGCSILVGLADVTHNKARSEAMAELIHAKNDFIAKVSHELRTPLTAVVGLAAELDSGDDLDDDDRAELIKLVAGQAREVAGIVEDLLVAARSELGSMTVLSKVVHLGEELYATVDGMGLELAHVDDPLPHVIADPGRVRQVIRNLLTNAQRYGGPRISVRAGISAGRAYVEVRDNGHGVPADLGQRIFEPYTGAGERPGESVGIGLSVSRQLAELMAGSLSYYRDGDETVFRLELPAASVSSARSLASQAADA